MKPLLRIILLVLIAVPAYAHQGRLDAYGCHNNRKAHSYQCHKGEFSGQTFQNKSGMIAKLGGNESLPDQESFKAKVIAVIDGDTIEVLHKGKALRIRLAEIDAPEMAQAYGPEARQFVIDQTLNQVVSLTIVATDTYGRKVAKVLLQGGNSLSREILKKGLAWWYRKYSSDAHLGRLEKAAHKKHLGLWETAPIPPWEFRDKAEVLAKSRN